MTKPDTADVALRGGRRRSHKRPLTEPCTGCRKTGGLHFGHGLCGACYKKRHKAKKKAAAPGDVALTYADTLNGGSWVLRAGGGGVRDWVPIDVLLARGGMRPVDKSGRPVRTA
jgi:hypothetical protein